MVHYKSSRRCQAITHSNLFYIDMCLIINRAYHIDDCTIPKDTYQIFSYGFLNNAIDFDQLYAQKLYNKFLT